MNTTVKRLGKYKCKDCDSDWEDYRKIKHHDEYEMMQLQKEIINKHSPENHLLSLYKRKGEIADELAKFYGDIKSWEPFTEAYSEYSDKFDFVTCADDCILETDCEITKGSQFGGKLARKLQIELNEISKQIAELIK